MNQQNMNVGFLTVDADAHLQKLTAHMFPSPALLPVELVRSALKRKAEAISIQVHSDRIAVSDNGDGISRMELHALACLGDISQSAAAREKALAYIHDLALPGIGLLAVFSPGARSIRIEAAAASGKSFLRIENGRSALQNSCSLQQGTSITIYRRRGPAAKEKTLLAELCAAVQAQIVINGRQLEKKSLLTDIMVSMSITHGRDSVYSLVAIPARGDVCRIWLLDQGIPWQVTTLAPIRGLVFAATLETASRPAPPTFETLSSAANHLYLWLAENYSQFSAPYQSRIENLFFKQARSENYLGFLSICAPFRLWNSSKCLNLAEVQRKAENGNLYVMDQDGQPDYFSGLQRDVLLLTPRQKDFLINHLRLPMVIMNARLKTKVRTWRILSFWRRKFLNLRRLFMTANGEILNSNRLRQEENDLCRELEACWRRKLLETAPDTASFSLSVVMVNGRGLFPAYWLRNDRGDILQIRRRHPLTQRAAQKISQDQENGELAFAALMPGYFLTINRQ